MQISRVEVRDFRNLTSVSLLPCPGLNIFEGDNASGKTSFLEALYFCGLVRSFRSNKIEQLIQQNKDAFTLFTEFANQGQHKLGLMRSLDQSLQIRLDGAHSQSRAVIANLFPLQLITPDSIELLIGGPAQRRSFLDWLLFHVEPSFHQHWNHYQRNLRQRNALLRQQKSATIEHWNEGLVTSGEFIDRFRSQLIEDLIPHIKQYVSELLPDMDLSISYRRGWRPESSLSEVIDQSLESDLKMKYTTVGPHRADLVIKDGNDKVAEFYSRGQLKLLLCALKLAQLSLFRERTDSTPVVLIDDLPAELDKRHRDLLLSLLHRLEAQVFVTTTSRALLSFKGWGDVKLFHVEHGQIKEVV